MEVKDGRITPTSKREARVYSRMLREQEVACERGVDSATVAEAGQPLSGPDSYKLFCGIERAVHAPTARPKVISREEATVFGRTLLGLAVSHLEALQLDTLQNEVIEMCWGNSDDDRLAKIGRLAAHALEDRYVD